MSAFDAQGALIQRLQGMSGRWAIAYPNDATAPTPRLVVQRSANAQRTATIGGTTDATAEIVVRLEVDEGAGEDEIAPQLALIMARFPVNARFDGVTITEAPNPRPALSGDGIYSVPVIIRGRTFF